MAVAGRPLTPVGRDVNVPPRREPRKDGEKVKEKFGEESGEKITHPSQEMKRLFNFTQAFTWKVFNSSSAFFALPKRSGGN
ncbi:hypothetical protein D4764_12G0008690 [Takifugu flavidus]|uniref:Uncharacterized protein n=1 Tax=Takifugu flavidus TaxID=433684 RepID=A0A5C6PEP6_9TELE|nr:hypothetical protein D4764_12G0008690 [Takifugu flavidus]